MQALGSTQVVAPYAPLEQDHQKFWVQVFFYILLQFKIKIFGTNTIGGITELSRPGFSINLVLV